MKKITKKITKFIVTHDEYSVFIIIYTLTAIVLAVFFGLFYFFLWVMLHFTMEMYENHIKKDPIIINFLRSVKECLFDIMFLFIGLSLEIIFHLSAAFAAGRSLGGIVKFIKITPKLIGIKSASEGTAHVLVAIIHHSKEKNHISEKNPQLEFNKWDFSAVVVIIIFVFLAFYVPLSLGSTVNEVIDAGISAFNPYEIKGFEIFEI